MTCVRSCSCSQWRRWTSSSPGCRSPGTEPQRQHSPAIGDTARVKVATLLHLLSWNSEYCAPRTATSQPSFAQQRPGCTRSCPIPAMASLAMSFSRLSVSQKVRSNSPPAAATRATWPAPWRRRKLVSRILPWSFRHACLDCILLSFLSEQFALACRDVALAEGRRRRWRRLELSKTADAYDPGLHERFDLWIMIVRCSSFAVRGRSSHDWPGAQRPAIHLGCRLSLWQETCSCCVPCALF
jgi:hypothetical protein